MNFIPASNESKPYFCNKIVEDSSFDYKNNADSNHYSCRCTYDEQMKVIDLLTLASLLYENRLNHELTDFYIYCKIA